jgi:hypothetical protein
MKVSQIARNGGKKSDGLVGDGRNNKNQSKPSHVVEPFSDGVNNELISPLPARPDRHDSRAFTGDWMCEFPEVELGLADQSSDWQLYVRIGLSRDGRDEK